MILEFQLFIVTMHMGGYCYVIVFVGVCRFHGFVCEDFVILSYFSVYKKLASWFFQKMKRGTC